MTRICRFALVPLLLLLAGGVRSPMLAQQPNPSGTGVISGQVVEGGTTRAVPGANVALISIAPRGPAREVITDAQGRYVFANLPAGEFSLTARKTGWRGGAFGLDTPAGGIGVNGEPIRLASGERLRTTVPVWRPALISGRVLDDAGEPLAGARLNASRWTTTGGRRRLGGGGSIRTDDRGYFTLSVDPGEYMLSAEAYQVRLVKGRPHVFRPMFYPGSFTTVGASTIAVKSGEERNGLALQMSLEPAYRIAGVVNRVAAGRTPAQLELQRIDGEVRPLLPRGVLDASGRFVFDHLPAGRYVLQTSSAGARPPQEPSDNMELWARVAIDLVDRDLDLSVDLRRHLIVSGRVRFDGTPPPPGSGDGWSVGVRLFREDELPLSDFIPAFTPVRADGTFALAVPPGRYVVSSDVWVTNPRASLPATPGRSWMLRAATLGGRDVADFPIVVTSDVSGLELTLTDQPSTLRGQVTTRQGRLEGAELLVFPVDQSLWAEFPVGRRFRSRRLTAEGTFELRNLPEGNYFVAAVRNAPSDFNSWVAPDFLAALARSARRVTVLEGQATTQDVEVIVAPRFNAALAPPPAVEPADRAAVREAAAAAAPAGATISGSVLAAGSNAPVAGARVGLTQGLVGFPSAGGAHTDDQGRFVLGDVPPGTHTLYITRPPYVNTVFGATRPNDPGTPVTVTAGQQMSGLTIRMTRGAAIGGTVLDQNGQPLPNAQISLRAYRWTARGREPVVQGGPAVFESSSTNARGEYRRYGLAPGDYMIQAALQGAATAAMPLTTQADIDAVTRPSSAAGAAASPVQVTYTPMFYPNTADPAAAQAVRLEPGQDRVIDFQFRLIPTATVSGVVRTADGQVPSRLSVNLAQNDPLAAPVPRSHFGTVDSSGAFTIRAVPPGRYLLTTSQLTAGSAPLVGALELFVDRDVSNVVLDVVPMTTVTGTIRGDVPAPLRQPGVRLALTPQPGTLVPPNQARSAVIAVDNRFSIPNIPPGRYRFEITGPNTVARPRVATQGVNGFATGDVDLDVKSGETINVDLELITSEAQVAGRLRDRAGQAATELYVVLFARDPKAWTPPSGRVFGLRPDQNGRYVFPDVPAGDYLITGLSGIDAGDWFDPAVLARLAGNASPVTVRRGDKLEIDLETR